MRKKNLSCFGSVRYANITELQKGKKSTKLNPHLLKEGDLYPPITNQAYTNVVINLYFFHTDPQLGASQTQHKH